jgi:hypothetical protein
VLAENNGRLLGINWSARRNPGLIFCEVVVRHWDPACEGVIESIWEKTPLLLAVMNNLLSPAKPIGREINAPIRYEQGVGGGRLIVVQIDLVLVWSTAHCVPDFGRELYEPRDGTPRISRGPTSFGLIRFPQ